MERDISDLYVRNIRESHLSETFDDKFDLLMNIKNKKFLYVYVKGYKIGENKNVWDKLVRIGFDADDGELLSQEAFLLQGA